MHPRTLQRLWRLSVAAVLVVPGAIISCTDSAQDGSQGSDAGSSSDVSSADDGSQESDGSAATDGAPSGDASTNRSEDAGLDSGDGGDATVVSCVTPVQFIPAGDCVSVQFGYDQRLETDIQASAFEGHYLTFTAWLRPDVLDDNLHGLFGNVVPNVGEQIEAHVIAGKVGFHYVVPGPLKVRHVFDEVEVVENEWHHYALVAGATATSLYVDGILRQSLPGAAGPLSKINNPGVLLIGRDADGADRSFSGNIDQVGVWARELTATEIRTVASGGAPPATDLVGYWPISQSDAGTYAPDIGPGQHNALLVNASFDASKSVCDGRGPSPNPKGRTCQEIEALGKFTGNGAYWIDPNGGCPEDSFRVQCRNVADAGASTVFMRGNVIDHVYHPENVGRVNGAYKLSDSRINATIALGTQTHNVKFSCGYDPFIAKANLKSGWLTQGCINTCLGSEVGNCQPAVDCNNAGAPYKGLFVQQAPSGDLVTMLNPSVYGDNGTPCRMNGAGNQSGTSETFFLTYESR